MQKQPYIPPTITVVAFRSEKGYADSGTGTSDINNRLARERAQAVARMLEENGIAAGRVSIEFLGGDRNSQGSPESNRVAVCVVE